MDKRLNRPVLSKAPIHVHSVGQIFTSPWPDQHVVLFVSARRWLHSLSLLLETCLFMWPSGRPSHWSLEHQSLNPDEKLYFTYIFFSVVNLQTFQFGISQSFLVGFSQGYYQIIQNCMLFLFICDTQLMSHLDIVRDSFMVAFHWFSYLHTCVNIQQCCALY